MASDEGLRWTICTGRASGYFRSSPGLRRAVRRRPSGGERRRSCDPQRRAMEGCAVRPSSHHSPIARPEAAPRQKSRTDSNDIPSLKAASCLVKVHAVGRPVRRTLPTREAGRALIRARSGIEGDAAVGSAALFDHRDAVRQVVGVDLAANLRLRQAEASAPPGACAGHRSARPPSPCNRTGRRACPTAVASAGDSCPRRRRDRRDCGGRGDFVQRPMREAPDIFACKRGRHRSRAFGKKAVFAGRRSKCWMGGIQSLMQEEIHAY